MSADHSRTVIGIRSTRSFWARGVFAFWLIIALGCQQAIVPATSQIHAQPPQTVGNLLQNGDFSAGLAPWWATSSVAADAASGALVATINNAGSNPWDAIVGQNGVNLQAGQTYTVTFRIRASTTGTAVVKLQKEASPYTSYFSQDVALTTSDQTHQFVFTSGFDDAGAAFQFQMGGQGNNVLTIDDVQVLGETGPAEPSSNLVQNGNFVGGIEPWWTSGDLSITTTDGACLTINAAGTNPWDVQLGQHNISLQAGSSYQLKFAAKSTTPVTLPVRLQQNAEPYTGYFATDPVLNAAWTEFVFNFTSAYSDAASLLFQIGGLGTPTICINHVSLEMLETGIRVNQASYLPTMSKIASLVHPATEPLAWQLHNAADTVVSSGQTTVYGEEAASAEHLHLIDFSSYQTVGEGYYLSIGSETSYAFAIEAGLYSRLKYDALAYFYHNRSGIAITMPYAGEQQWTRPAGHIGVAPNQGDTSVTCFTGTDNQGQTWPGCDYQLDVSKGWYDAGDHGKYVVNSGISVWTLLNQYERAQQRGAASLAQFADGSMNIPENNNGVPDLLDEVRWNMEFMLGMQIPTTAPVSKTGMVHHKVHDAHWTGLPMAPHDDSQMRYLYPPSTAATLNLAATAAQCSRIWRGIDEAFADRCLVAAERAWQAALAYPNEIASDHFDGGGGYGDSNLNDEWYWAAAELYVTTGSATYRDAIADSQYYLKLDVGGGSAMNWGSVASLGTLSLALVPNNLSTTERQAARAAVIAAADQFVAAQQSSGYGIPYNPGSQYPWGSNSSILNNMIVIGLAGDFTGEASYADAISQGMDYLLGRNPLNRSYISGYGAVSLTNPHHRFWAKQLDPSYPGTPPGVVAGGPNSGIQDPYAQAELTGCAALKCYVDHIDSWSTNEVTINWNSPLAWVAAYLDDYDTGSVQYLPLINK